MGCRLNLAEGEAVRRAAADLGPDAVIINSCAVTNEAVRQTRQKIRRAKRARPEARVFVTGCAAQIDPQTFAAMPEVDGVVGNHEKLNAASWRPLASETRRTEKTTAPVLVNDIMSVRETAPELVEGYGERARAFLQIQNGCDHRCTFCIIPYGRGGARSAPARDVLAQARRLVDKGYKELVLTGVDITSWGGDLEGSPPLGRLVAQLLDEVDGLFRLRLSSVDGAEIDDALAERLAGDERLAPYLHLSVQSGDNMILKRMKRRHSREDVISLCGDLRARRPEMAFGADMIAGFPTETDDMFENSRDLIDEAGLNYLHVFPFSPRAGTPAARMPQLPRPVIKARAAALRARGAAASEAFYRGLAAAGRKGRIETGIMEAGGAARLGNFALVRIESGETVAPGKIARVRPTDVKAGALVGVLT